MLWVFSFLALSLVCFVLFPATAIVIGFIMGSIAIYRGLEPNAGTLAMQWSGLTWEYWEIALISIVVLATMFTTITKAVQKSGRFRKIKIIREEIKKKVLKEETAKK